VIETYKELSKESIDLVQKKTNMYPSLGGAVCSTSFCCCGELSSRLTETLASSTTAKLYGVLESRLTSVAASVSESCAEN